MARLVLTSLVLVALLVAPPATAIVIEFEATDLNDTSPGDDLWRYSYSVSGFDFDTDYGFTIFGSVPSPVEKEEVA